MTIKFQRGKKVNIIPYETWFLTVFQESPANNGEATLDDAEFAVKLWNEKFPNAKVELQK